MASFYILLLRLLPLAQRQRERRQVKVKTITAEHYAEKEVKEQ